MAVPREILPAGEIPSQIASLATAAMAKLGLDLGAVVIRRGSDPAVVMVDAAPLLGQWLTHDETLASLLARTVGDKVRRDGNRPLRGKAPPCGNDDDEGEMVQ